MIVKLTEPRNKEKKEKERKKFKNGEPKKSTGRDGEKSNSEQDKHLKKKKFFPVQEQ
jgi:hypothetical protein